MMPTSSSSFSRYPVLLLALFLCNGSTPALAAGDVFSSGGLSLSEYDHVVQMSPFFILYKSVTSEPTNEDVRAVESATSTYMAEFMKEHTSTGLVTTSTKVLAHYYVESGYRIEFQTTAYFAFESGMISQLKLDEILENQWKDDVPYFQHVKSTLETSKDAAAASANINPFLHCTHMVLQGTSSHNSSLDGLPMGFILIICLVGAIPAALFIIMMGNAFCFPYICWVYFNNPKVFELDNNRRETDGMMKNEGEESTSDNSLELVEENTSTYEEYFKDEEQGDAGAASTSLPQLD
mmetsp:Transcript_20675/g.26683  ORF Transcript_20675/g.26683 Transcript_20675/m.26683 type:complete len:294 (-) Transcript_20675:291-1172(-)